MLDSSRLEFFPLQVGNLWQWRDTHVSSKIKQWEIISDTVITGKKYYKSITAVPRTIASGLVRIDSLFYVQTYIGRPCGESQDEYNTYRLAETEGVSYEICHEVADILLPKGYKLSMKYNYTFQASSFGKYRDILEFKYGGINGSDTIFPFTFYLVRGIGIYFEEYEIFTYQCTGAIINGKVYGTVVKMENENSLPEKVSLSNAYPNPCSNNTHIDYAIDEDSFVTFKVYSILGEEVKTIPTEKKQAGKYKVLMNINDLKNGIYIYQLFIRSNNKMQTLSHKIIIIR